ncbi:DUF6527 family protein [Sphingomonas sp. ID0503]|uniref:DUF6527 family protein n=1 Tax=Sphingomonas sp. ID0503 TaxID=3399691 RepID=UPI003AFA1284
MSAFIRLSDVLMTTAEGALAFRCPACNSWHVVSTSPQARQQWTWNGDVERPTISPSILVRCGSAVDPTFKREPGDPPDVCHSFVVNGQIQFCGDSTHELAGQTVDLPPFALPEGE